MVLNREEMFIANICGESYDLPAPQTRNELLLKSILDGDETALSPVTRIELYLASISGKDVGDLPQPRTRIEMYLAAIAGMEIEPPIPLTSLEQWLASWYESGGSGEEFTTEFLPIVSIMDALAKPARAVVAKMEPIQDLHGYDSPWPAGGGKNLWNPQPYTGLNYNIDVGLSVTLTESTGVTVNGNKLSFSVPVGWDYKDFKTKPLAAGTYRIHFSNSLESGFRGTWYVVGDTGAGDVVKKKETFSSIAGDRDKNITVETNDYIVLQVASTNVTTIELVDWQIESGSSYTSWSPYENLCPISGRTGVTVYHSGADTSDPQTYPVVFPALGKNLYNLGSQTTSANNTYNIIDLEPNTDYVFSVDVTQTGLYAEYDNSGTWTTYKSVYNNTALTFNSGTYTKLRLMTYSSSSNNPTKFQLETGTSVTPYEPYVDTVYGGTLDLVSGLLTVKHGLHSFTGDEYWSFAQASGHYRAYTNIVPIADYSGSPLTITDKILCCNLFPIVAWGTVYYGELGCGQTGQYVGFGMDAIGISAESDWRDFLRNNTISLVYELATPQTYQLTPTQIQMLKGANVLWSDADAVQVTYLKKKDS